MTAESRHNLSELAYHIVSLREYWKRTGANRPKDKGFRALRNMIEIGLGIDSAERLTRAVLGELDAISADKPNVPIDPEGIEVCFISALLQEEAEGLPVPSASSYWQSLFAARDVDLRLAKSYCQG